MTEADNIKQFLSDVRKELISIRKLEDLAEVPRSTIKNFLNNERGLPLFHQKKIIPFLELVGYKSLNDGSNNDTNPG